MDICTETSCREWPALKLTQSTRADLSVTLRDSSGEPLEISPDTHSVELTVKEWESGATTYFARECTISETQEGMVSLRVNSSDIPYAGTWVGEFTVTKDVSDSSEEEPEFEPFVEYRLRCYVEVAMSIRASTPGRTRPLTVFEIRMAIRDRAPQDNTFLEELEFSDTEILYVMQRAVDIWNESLPPIRQSYTYTTFPFRYQWTEACVGELFRMAGAQLIRNDFKVNAGGIQLEDGNRAASYLQLGNSMVESYKAWVLQKKYSLNMEAGWGRTTNPDFDY